MLVLILLSFLCICTNEGAMKFPDDFKFGAATASYQVEGGWNASGKGENIWDHLTHTRPSLVKDKSNGDVACDSYHKYKEDVAILKTVGVDFYRFSLSWSRLLPYGYSNYTNPDGVRYYNDLINELLANKIEPMVTLYHWDLPKNLQDLGGWTNEVLVSFFEDYADVAFKLFGDRVKLWITFNEPNSFCEGAYASASGAPYFRYSGTADYLCGKTVLIAHAAAYRLYDKVYRKEQKGKVGITIDAIWAEPATTNAQDQDAALRTIQMVLGWWAHPIYSKSGDYPEIMMKRIQKLSRLENFTRSRLPKFSSEEVNLIRGTHDFFGLNHYSTWLTSDNEQPVHNPPSYGKDVGVKVSADPSWNQSAVPWQNVVPWGFRKLLKFIKDEYDNPEVLVTENGFADLGGLDDQGRIDYHKSYLGALLEAINIDGCNVKAYTAWSIMDNFEWLEGYSVRFGMYQVDFNDPNRKRTPKASSSYYTNVIKNRSNDV